MRQYYQSCAGVCLHTASSVEKTVASLDGCVDLVCASVVVDFPQTKAHEGHVITTVELDDGRSHFVLCIACWDV